MRATRKIVQIDEEKCNGCGLCISACHEGAIALIDGKARLVSDTYCDGLGACLGDCPEGAITIIEREADAFSEEAVAAHLKASSPTPPALSAAPAPAQGHGHGHGHAHGTGPRAEACGCPGAAMRSLEPAAPAARPAPGRKGSEVSDQPEESSLLGHWPVQLSLIPPTAPFLRGADLVVCADCVPFAVPDFHQRYLSQRSVIIGCPKLDDLEYYAEKLRLIMRTARPAKVTVLRMEVPCCGGIAQATVQAVLQEGLEIPLEVHVVGIRGGIMKQVVRS